MNTTEINRLLEKYYRGESSEEEELLLRRFFDNENIPAGFESDKALFRYFSENESAPQPSEMFEKNIISAVDSVERKNRAKILKYKIIAFSGIAACIIFLFGTYFFFMRQDQPEDTFSNPEIAYAETVKVLYTVSSTLNHGTKQLNKVGKLEDAATIGFEAINKSRRIIGNNLKNLDYFQQAINMVQSPMDRLKTNNFK